MSDAVIEVTGVDKKFRLYHERPQSLKEAIVQRRRPRYDELWALRDISLEIPPGTTYGVIGHNGSGKSTLLRLMAGIHQPTAGRVVTNGRIAALLELGAGFHPDLTGRENVYLNGSIMGLSKKEIARAFDAIVDFSGLEQFIDSPVKVYSSGMYVRLGFSVAVNLEPEILLVDEIIAVGDEDFQRRCMDHMFNLRQGGTTIVFVSHALPVVQTLCDAAAWLDHGRMMADGDAASVAAAYLDSVNAAERARLEAGGEMGAAPAGSAGIAVASLDFVGAGGDRLVAGSTGDPITIRLAYSAATRVADPVFGLAFHHESGVHVAGPNSRFGNLVTGTVEGDGYIDFHLDRLPLLPGTYLVTAAIFDTHMMHPYDYRDKAFVLRVQPGSSPERYGMVELTGTWSGPHHA